MPGTPSRAPAVKLTSPTRGRTLRRSTPPAKRAHSPVGLYRPVSRTPPTSPHNLQRRSVGRLGLLSDPHNDLLFTRNDRVKGPLETPMEVADEENYSPGYYERKRAATRSRHLAYRQAVKGVKPSGVTRSKKEELQRVVAAKARRPERGYGLPKPVGARKNGPSVLNVLEKRGVKSAPPGHEKAYRTLLD